jgi:hypothetical protein
MVKTLEIVSTFQDWIKLWILFASSKARNLEIKFNVMYVKMDLNIWTYLSRHSFQTRSDPRSRFHVLIGLSDRLGQFFLNQNDVVLVKKKKFKGLQSSF